MQTAIKKLDQANEENLKALVIYAVLWYIPLIVGFCLLTFIPIGLIVVHLNNKKKERDKTDEFYTGY